MAAGLFALMALLPVAILALGGSYLLSLGERVMIFAIAALSLELLIGVAGLVSFGHAAFLGVGAYAAGMLASHGHGTLALALAGRDRGLRAVRAPRPAPSPCARAASTSS